MNKLAIFNGKPIRSEAYPIHTTIINDDEEKAIVEVLRGNHLSGFSARPGDRFLGGPNVKKLEQEFSKFFGTSHAVSFNSATSALHGALAAAKIGPGDEVITSPYTMTATAASILMQNAIPIFADIEDRTYGLDPKSVKDRISKNTKAVLAVNLYGHPCRLIELKQICEDNKLILIEDNSQAPGALINNKMCGTVGEMGIQSLNYHKVIQTGEGGMLITNNKEYAFHNQLKRNHGEVVVGKLENINNINVLGYNYRLTEIQAAMGIYQIKKLDFLNQYRIDLANELTELLKTYDFLSTPIVEDNCTHVYYHYPIRYIESEIGIPRSVFLKALKAEGISVTESLNTPLYFEPIFKHKRAHAYRYLELLDRNIEYPEGLCPVAEKIMMEEVFITDICKYPNSSKEIKEFELAIKKITKNISSLKSLNG